MSEEELHHRVRLVLQCCRVLGIHFRQQTDDVTTDLDASLLNQFRVQRVMVVQIPRVFTGTSGVLVKMKTGGSSSEIIARMSTSARAATSPAAGRCIPLP